MDRRIFHSSGAQRKLFNLLIALSLIILPLGTVFFNARASTPPVPSASFTAEVLSDGGSAPLTLRVPESASVGDQVTFILEGVDLQDVAGFQAVLRFDPAALQFAGAALSDEFSQSGGSPMKVGPAVLDGQVLLGGASCPVAECNTTHYAEAVRQTPRLSGSLPLGSFTFVVVAPGEHAVQVTDTQLVDASGKVLFSAQPVSQKFDATTAKLSTLDRTDNRFINDTDASILRNDWVSVFEAGGCAALPVGAEYDLNGSGCLDVADVQMILAHWGEGTTGGALLRAQPQAPAADLTLVVNDSGDAGDANPGNGACATASGVCTLRAAVEESNAYYGQETINFNVRGPGGTCPSLVTIRPQSVIRIEDLDDLGVVINGYSQCDAQANTGAVAGNAVIKIELFGPETITSQVGSGGVNGLELHSANNVIRGLAIYGYKHNLLIQGSHANFNIVQGNFIGTNAANSYTARWTSNVDADGLRFHFDGQNNLIGGTQPADRNIISGALQDGIGMRGDLAHHNTIIGNYVGLEQNGSSRRANGSDGIDLGGGANNNKIGGLVPGERNVISGNGNDGVELSHDSATTANEIVGNFIGVNASGAGSAQNNWFGITLEDNANGNLFHRNIIAGNGAHGISLATVHHQTITENFIGVVPQGLAALQYVVPNPISIPLSSLTEMKNGLRNIPADGLSGIYIFGGSQHNLIKSNVIANHVQYGVYIDADDGFPYITNRTCQPYFNTISENRIFDNKLDGIFFRPDNCSPDPTIYYPNENLAAPVITSANTSLVAGTACNNCTVELFLSDKTALSGSENAGEGKLLVGKGKANASGQFSIAVSGLAKDDIITGTSTDDKGNTSRFAVNVLVAEAPPVTVTPPTETPVTPTPPTVTPVTPTPPTVTPSVTVTPDPKAKHVYLPVIRR